MRSFAQTGPPFSCLVADQTRLHQMIDGSWILEGWGYAETGDDRTFRVVSREHAAWWLGLNGFDAEVSVSTQPGVFRSMPRGDGFRSTAETARGMFDSLVHGLESVG